MRRRSFVAGLSLFATNAVPFEAFGQTRARRHRLAFITGVPPEGAATFLARFIEGMKELGYREGVNFDIEPRYGRGDKTSGAI